MNQELLYGIGIKEGHFSLLWGMELYWSKVIVSIRESGMWSCAKKSGSKGNFIVKVLLCDLRFDIWIQGSWIGLKGLTVIILVDIIKKRETY